MSGKNVKASASRAKYSRPECESIVFNGQMRFAGEDRTSQKSPLSIDCPVTISFGAGRCQYSLFGDNLVPFDKSGD